MSEREAQEAEKRSKKIKKAQALLARLLSAGQWSRASLIADELKAVTPDDPELNAVIKTLEEKSFSGIVERKIMERRLNVAVLVVVCVILIFLLVVHA